MNRGPELDASALQQDIQELRDRITGLDRELVVKVVVHQDTVRARGLGHQLSTPMGRLFVYRDRRLDFHADLETDSVRYTIFPRRFGLIMGLSQDWAWARAWDVDSRETLAVDSIRISRKEWSFGVFAGPCYEPARGWFPEAGAFAKRGKWGAYAKVGPGLSAGLVREW